MRLAEGAAPFDPGPSPSLFSIFVGPCFVSFLAVPHRAPFGFCDSVA